MDNELRIERVKAGIKRLREGREPYSSDYDLERELGVNEACSDILFVNAPGEDGIKNGFKSSHMFDIKVMLHNWRRFLQLIEKL